MGSWTVGIVGTGGIAQAHANAWGALEHCEIVGCVDIDKRQANAFAETHGLPASAVYADTTRFLTEVEPDIVSVCTPESTHESVVIDIARTGIPLAVHAEKAMADTWGGAQRLAHECNRRGIQLTINHQRRFGEPWRDVKAALDAGIIGDLQRLEFSFTDLFTYGTHQIDTFGLWNGDRPAEWVIGQIDYRTENIFGGVDVENQATGIWQYDNGVYGMVSTGPGKPAVGSYSRVVGTTGDIRIEKNFDDDDPESYSVTISNIEDDTIERTSYETEHSFRNSAQAVIDGLESGESPGHCAENALKVTEIIFAMYESSRRRGRIDLPLDISDNPLTAMVESGELTPAPREVDR